ncbi:hypothetical protein F5Y11DRAFT_356773 [Daldinia sp. FL1419]|nr:hypothetical protein F5Y11DRAFT_356773 [Daldinia sp. FL1419]
MWKYEKLYNISMRNVVVRLGVKEGHVTKTRYRRLIIKRALSTMAEDLIRNEIETIEGMHPSVHILNPIATCQFDSESEDEEGQGGNAPAENAPPGDAPAEGATGISGLFRRLTLRTKEATKKAVKRTHIPSRLRRKKRDRKMTTQKFIQELNLTALDDYPYIISEFLENGTLNRFIERVGYHNLDVPNRILWSFALCTMAYGRPSAEDINARLGGEIPDPRLETVPPDAGAARHLVHGTMQDNNFLIGSPGGFPEHDLVVPLNLVGWSHAHIEMDQRGPKENLYMMGRLLFMLAMGDKNGQILQLSMEHPAIQNGVMTEAAHIYDRDTIDLDMKNLIGYWMCTDPNVPINLGYLLEQIEREALRRDQEFYSGVARETDVSVRAFLQLMIYDAPDDRGPGVMLAEQPPIIPMPVQEPVFFPDDDDNIFDIGGPADTSSDEDGGPPGPPGPPPAPPAPPAPPGEEVVFLQPVAYQPPGPEPPNIPDDDDLYN